MHHFAYRGGVLCAEQTPLPDIAAAAGTPTYVYALATLRRHYKVLAEAFGAADLLIAYAVKANANLSVIASLARAGAGADVVSEGEIRRALAAGVTADRIVFSGVGKTRAELAFALNAEVFQINVESEAELAALSEVAAGLGVIAPVAIRVNPDVAAGGHDKISTGRAADKFGIAWSRARTAFEMANASLHIRVQGLAMHIGSQIASLAPFEAAIRKAVGLITELRGAGVPVETFDIGGGLAIPYHDGAETPPAPSAYADLVMGLTAGLGVRLILEPGRLIVGNAGVLLARVTYIKESEGRTFLVLDAGMNDLIRPAIYGARHAILPVKERSDDAPRRRYDVVGPVCESSDIFARDVDLPELEEGELVAFLSAGAYGAAQASQYNSRPLAAEAIVGGDKWKLVRPRPSYEAMTATEVVPNWIA